MPDDLFGFMLRAPASLASRIDTGFVRAIPELDDPGAALDFLRRFVSRKVLVTPSMAKAMVEGLVAQNRRTSLRQIAQALESGEPPPFPPELPFQILWGAEDAITAPPQETTPMLRVIDRVGHMPHIEAASEVVSAVRRALAKDMT